MIDLFPRLFRRSPSPAPRGVLEMSDGELFARVRELAGELLRRDWQCHRLDLIDLLAGEADAAWSATQASEAAE